MKTFSLRIALLLSGVFFILQSAFAWNARFVVDAPIRWHSDTNTVGFKLQDISFPVGSPQRTAILDAFRILNLNVSRIRARVNPDVNWVSVGNGQNEVWFTDNQLVLSGAPAIAISHFNPFAFGVWNLMESDVIFDVGEVYTSSQNKSLIWNFGGPFRPLRSTALHELGHAMGLQHENRIYNIMGEDWTHIAVNGNQVRGSIGEDFNEGLVRIYGANPSAVPDLGVSPFKYLGTDGEYSTHQKTVAFNARGGALPSFFTDASDADPMQVVHQVTAGQWIQNEFTYENNGIANATVRVTYVLSTNPSITTLDRVLFTEFRRFSRDTPETRRLLLRLPTDLPSGQRFYLGVIVDADNTVRESTETNNATYVPIQVL